MVAYRSSGRRRRSVLVMLIVTSLLLITLDVRSGSGGPLGAVRNAPRDALAPGGTLLVVTKQPGWYLETLPNSWRDVAREIVKNYHLIEAVREG